MIYHIISYYIKGMMNVREGRGELLFMLIFLIGDLRYLLIISPNLIQ